MDPQNAVSAYVFISVLLIGLIYSLASDIYGMVWEYSHPEEVPSYPRNLAR